MLQKHLHNNIYKIYNVYAILHTYYLYIIQILRKLCLERILKVYIIYIKNYK